MDDRTIETTARDLALRLLAAIGLGVSTLLLVQYLSPAHSLCTHGGCATVRQSSYSAWAGVPTPVLGIAYFAAVIGLSLAPISRQRVALAAFTGLGAVAAGGFIALQLWVIDAVCEYCTAADAIAIAVFGIAVSLVKTPRPAVTTNHRIMNGVLAASAVSVGIVAPMLTSTAPYIRSMPPEIHAEQREGKVTVVEFMDFGCPACRLQHEEFQEVFPRYGDAINLVYKQVPLPMHRGAKDAARAYLCAGDPARAKKLAHAFFTADKLSPEIVRGIAEAHGADMAAYDACVAGEETRKTLEAHHQLATDLGIRGLPTFWIGDERFEGVQSSQVLRDSVERARAAGM